jgi:hypothetical protein
MGGGWFCVDVGRVFIQIPYVFDVESNTPSFGDRVFNRLFESAIFFLCSLFCKHNKISCKAKVIISPSHVRGGGKYFEEEENERSRG